MWGLGSCGARKITHTCINFGWVWTEASNQGGIQVSCSPDSGLGFLMNPLMICAWIPQICSLVSSTKQNKTNGLGLPPLAQKPQEIKIAEIKRRCAWTRSERHGFGGRGGMNSPALPAASRFQNDLDDNLHQNTTTKEIRENQKNHCTLER